MSQFTSRPPAIRTHGSEPGGGRGVTVGNRSCRRGGKLVRPARGVSRAAPFAAGRGLG